MVDCLSWYSCYGGFRSSTKLYSKEKRQNQNQYCLIDPSNLNCLNNDTLSKKNQQNINNNNNTSPQTIEEKKALLHFYGFNVSRERNLHLSTNSYDKRLLVLYNIPNSLYKIGLRNGDVLVYFNETNILKPPIALTIDRVKSEFTALRRQNKPIQIGICRFSDRSLLNNTTIKHLGSLTAHEFENLSQENRKSSATVNTDSKKLKKLFSNKKKSNSNSNRDSGFIETDADPSLTFNSHKHRSKTSPDKSDEGSSIITQKSLPITHPGKPSIGISSSPQVLNKHRRLPTQIVTDACFVYRREVVKPTNSNDMILRGREIAYEAAHSPTIPSSMPNYTHDQIRELYGELDKKTRHLQKHDYIIHKPMIDAWKEKSPWIDECPLPKFRLEKNEQAILLSAYLSTGLSNNPRTITNPNDNDIIRGSFRTSIADRTSITPSPLIFNVRLDFNKILPSSIGKQSQTPRPIIPALAEISELMDIDCSIDLDEETTIIPYDRATESRMEINPLVIHENSSPSSIRIIDENHSVNPSDQEENLSVDNLIRIVRAIHDFHFVYDEISQKSSSEIFTDNQEKEENLQIEGSDLLYSEDNDYRQITRDIDDDFEDLYERYMTKLDQYETMMQQLDQFEQKQDLLTPISEESVILVEHREENQTMQRNSHNELCLTCERQANHIGHYGFELEQTSDGKILISSIINPNYCPNLKIGDEILSINNYSTFKTLEQYHLLFHSLWHQQHDYVQITVRKPQIPASGPVSLQSSSLSWPLSIAESEPQNNI